MLERIVLAAIVTFCVYLYLNINNIGEKPPRSSFIGGKFTHTPNLLRNTPFFTR